MKIYDISQEVFSCCVFPGDPKPEAHFLSRMEEGSLYNLSSLSMCAHNGTHVDAPAHFLQDGKTIDQLPPEQFVGPVFVAWHQGVVTADDARQILKKAGSAQRILIRGTAVVSLEAAKVFAEAKLQLLGNESQTVGPEDAPMAVHKVLLGAGVVLLEGIRLAHVPEGKFLLCAAPLNLAGLEGAPCRAILIAL